MRRLLLCADDFAFSPEVSAVIAGLASRGKLNATSCMAFMPVWAEDSALLRDLHGHVEIGLHLVLTGEKPLTDLGDLTENGALPGIDPLARRAARGGVPRAAGRGSRLRRRRDRDAVAAVSGQGDRQRVAFARVARGGGILWPQ